jgi:hypothetical protein
VRTFAPLHAFGPPLTGEGQRHLADQGLRGESRGAAGEGRASPQASPQGVDLEGHVGGFVEQAQLEVLEGNKGWVMKGGVGRGWVRGGDEGWVG